MRSRSLAAIAITFTLLAVNHLSVFAIERSAIDNGYKWKPEDIYSNLSMWQADMDTLKSNLDKLAAFKGSFSGPSAKDAAKSLIAFNKLREQTDIKLEHADDYVTFNFHVDMGNSEWTGRQQSVNDLEVNYGQKLAWLEPELLQIPHDTLLKWVDQNSDLGSYRKQYEDMYALRKHTLSEPEENIIALSQNITGTAGSVFNKLSDVDLDFGYVLDSKGDTLEVSYPGWVSHATDKDRSLREKFFKAVWEKYDRYGNTFAELMAGQIKKDLYLTKARKYDNTLQRALDNTFIPVDVYSNLVATTESNTEPLYKYEGIRKRMLGLDHYRHWDYYVNLVPVEEKRYTWDEGVKLIEKALKPLGKDYIENISHALNPGNGWVDAYASDGKRSGAYSSSCYGVHPYMLFNFDYKQGLTLEDVSTIAHEVGHSMHSFYSEKNQPFPNKDYAIFNAEVASTTNEALLAMTMLDEARKDYKTAKAKDKAAARQRLIALLAQNLDAVRGTFYRQVMFADWEWKAHQMGEEGKPLTKGSFDKLYSDLLSKYQGPALEYEALSGVSWSMIPHFYRGYYVYTYATSYAAAVALAKDIRAEANGDKSKKGATARYLNYLKSGSSKHPVELLKDAGVDMTTPAPIESLISYFSNMVDELDKLSKEK